MRRRSYLSGIGLQFFAEGDGGTGGSETGAGGSGSPDGAGGSGAGGNDQGGKTFTQEEVNRMLANEKRQGRSSLMKELGLDVNDKDAVKKAKTTLDEHKSQSQRDSEALETEKNARSEAEKRAEAAERKFALMDAGCKKEFMDEVLALASVKVSDTVDFEAAVKEVKTKMPTLFADGDSGDDGTGSGQGHKRGKGGKAGSLGTRLAQNAVSSTPKENPYFKN